MKTIKLLSLMLLFVVGTVNAGGKENMSACNVAKTFKKMSNYKVAVEMYNECIEKGNLQPKNLAKAYGDLGDTLYFNRSYEKADESYKKAIKAYPEDAVVYQIKQANALENSGSFNAALAVYDKILDKNPNNAAVMFSKGLIYEDQNKINKAKQYYLKSKENGFESSYLDSKLKKHGLVN